MSERPAADFLSWVGGGPERLRPRRILVVRNSVIRMSTSKTQKIPAMAAHRTSCATREGRLAAGVGGTESVAVDFISARCLR